MNYLDIGVVVILIIFLIKGRIQGFIKCCFSFVPTIGALFITNASYPYVSSFLRGTFIFEKIKEGVASAFGLEAIDNFLASNMKEIQIVELLNLPEFLKGNLIDNNNAVIYNVLGVDSFGDYVSAYIANACINAICVVIIFVASVLVLKLIINMLDLVSKLPGINFLNKTLGAFLGVVQGIIVLWIVGIFLVFLYSNPNLSEFFLYLSKSNLAIHLYENNLLLFMILKIMV